MQPFAPVGAAPNLADQVAAALRARVDAGTFDATSRLPTESQLSQQFGVSRTVVREAVSRLKSEGLLLSRQGSGLYVRPGAHVKPLRIAPDAGRSEQAVRHIVELRRAIEGESAALAAERRRRADVDAMRTALRDLERAVARGEDGVAEDVRFHRLVAEASRNPYILSVLAFLGQYLHDATRVTRANEARRIDFAAAVGREHAAILAAIDAGDAAAARRAAARHMDNAKKRIAMAGRDFWVSAGDELAGTLQPKEAAPARPRAAPTAPRPA
ncbi:MAG: FadR family transcriptional regulator [Burkholderiales bacterium]|nr:FadR family transcriptional regulator [Burkholderiales bacterium]